MSEPALIPLRFGDLLIFVGSICFFFGVTVALLELKSIRTDRPVVAWGVVLIAETTLIFGLFWLVEPIRYLWGAAALGLTIGVVTVVGMEIIAALATTPIGHS